MSRMERKKFLHGTQTVFIASYCNCDFMVSEIVILLLNERKNTTVLWLFSSGNDLLVLV
jgi:hypothetical protein